MYTILVFLNYSCLRFYPLGQLPNIDNIIHLMEATRNNKHYISELTCLKIIKNEDNTIVTKN